MENNVVTISLERYAELVIAENKLDTLKKITKGNTRSFGYDEKTASGVDAILYVCDSEKCAE